MGRLDTLVSSYSDFITVPWKNNNAPEERVIFGIYEPIDELKIRKKIDEFAQVTAKAEHDWIALDLEHVFENWLSSSDYKESFFQDPEYLISSIEDFVEKLTSFILESAEDFLNNSNAVIALYGVGALYGLIKVNKLIEILSPSIAGRLLVFFPGSYEDNNCRLLNGYDGWNYLAVVLNK